ncbi:MAG: hypothetical protein LBJ67_04345 [Planctomycetaceae bacterium]|jgi:hypothetical protein|nr:hypothetical protein [Planctomycetaceae bacterium]
MGSFFDRLAKKAGITLWTKPAQNLRLTASNRVVREFGVICESEWIGHSPEIAKEHYLRVQMSDYEIAASQTLENKGFPEMSGGFSEKGLIINPRLNQENKR